MLSPSQNIILIITVWIVWWRRHTRTVLPWVLAEGIEGAAAEGHVSPRASIGQVVGAARVQGGRTPRFLSTLSLITAVANRAEVGVCVRLAGLDSPSGIATDSNLTEGTMGIIETPEGRSIGHHKVEVRVPHSSRSRLDISQAVSIGRLGTPSAVDPLGAPTSALGA